MAGMQARVVDLEGREPEVWFGALLDRLGGEWHLETARDAWRGERVVNGVLWVVGLERDGPDWIVGWRAEPEVPDGWGLGLMLVALGAAAIVLVGAGALGVMGPPAFAVSVLCLGAVLGLGRRALAASLPSVDGPTLELARAIDAAMTP